MNIQYHFGHKLKLLIVHLNFVVKLLLKILITKRNGAPKFTQGMAVNSNLIGTSIDNINTKLINKEENFNDW